LRRRVFLAGSATAAASLTWPALSAGTGDGVAAASWTLGAVPNRYVVRLNGASLITDCAGATTEPDSNDVPEDAAMVVAGPRREPVAWRIATSHQTGPLTLRIALAAVRHPLTADIVLAIDPATGLLSRTTVLRHLGIGAAIDIFATLGFWYRIHEPIDRMVYLAGEWAHETQVRRGHGDVSLALESRAGKTGFEFQPYVALESDTTTWLCQIFWSGNWSLRVVPGDDGAVLSGGLNNWRFRHRLGPGGSLALPTVLFGRFAGNLNAATQRLHDYRRARRPNPDRPIPVQFNSWYPYFGEPTSDAMLAFVPTAKHLGCEAFVVDAGWYRTDEGESAEGWEARTGDWHISRTRFPNGLREVSAACREQGMRFGLWFEPEVIGPLSAIRSEHPEWLHHLAGRPPAADQRGILNLGIPAARRHVFERVTRILSTVGVGWMKWDFNADLDAGGWAPGLPAVLTDQDPLVAHYQGLYQLQDAIRRWFPDLILEMCSSGGGRMDGEILAHAHLNWISDQPGALRKLAIHFGSQLAHPAVECNDWLVEWPPGSIAGYDEEDAGGLDERGDLPFRLRVAMLGSFGISARADQWSVADFATAAAHIALYRDKLRAIIHHGDQYLLTRPPVADGSGDWAAIWYVTRDGLRGVLFAFRLGSPEASRSFPLPGLAAGLRYRVSLYSGAATEAMADTLMAGMTVVVPGQFQSELCLVEAG
jgi:alpha-galactosidase